jgi:ubiquinone/menaquinone biosynthesis C-methylase UbiE
MITPSRPLPLPPLELRYRVGPTDPADYDNPDGSPILGTFGLPVEAYDAVFDFGCGCGRQARQLLQQNPRPRRYVGIDLQQGSIEWCQQNLAPVDSGYQFVHHDVYSPWYAPENSLQLSRPFPVEDASFSLLIATSVFTHLTMRQAEYYLSEVARVLTPQGIAYTTWLFFDRASFSFADVYCLYTSEVDFGQAVLFDREWFLATVRRLGLAVRMTVPPQFAGHQWVVLLVKRTPGIVDEFPLGMDEAEWVCGATVKPMASATLTPDLAAKHRKSREVVLESAPPSPPPLFGALAELDAMKRSNAWAIGRAITSPVRMVKRFLGSGVSGRRGV